MKEAFRDVCEKKSLIPEEYFWEKIVQIYDMMVIYFFIFYFFIFNFHIHIVISNKFFINQFFQT